MVVSGQPRPGASYRLARVYVKPSASESRMNKSKSKKHEQVTKDYQKSKSKHLERLASKMLDNDAKFENLKNKKTKGKFLDNF